ncbi:hypothetical protein A9266_09595 [Vibrio tasmaniensis]|nr:hypothetical protein A9266_09595 [Vibrio tasmaniensis]
MNRLINNICFMLLVLTSGTAVAEKPTTHIFGVGVNYGYNFDGDMFDNSQSISLLYQYQRLQLNLGIKHYKLLDNSEYIPDLGLLYSIDDGEKLDLKVGVGIEDKYPTIEYLAEYAVNSHIGINVALNQVLNDDFGQNQREVVIGLSYFFFDSSERNSSGAIEARPYSLNTDSSKACQIQVDKNECQVDINVDKKPELKPKLGLPYVVKEGDWLYQLHRDYDFDLEKVIKDNNIKDPDLIIPGQILE